MTELRARHDADLPAVRGRVQAATATALVVLSLLVTLDCASAQGCYLPYAEWERQYREARALRAAYATSLRIRATPGQPYDRDAFIISMGAEGFDTGHSMSMWGGSRHLGDPGGHGLPDRATVIAQIEAMKETWERCYRPQPIRVQVHADVQGQFADCEHEATITLNPVGRHSPDLWVAQSHRGVEVRYEGIGTMRIFNLEQSAMLPECTTIQSSEVTAKLGAQLGYSPANPSQIDLNFSLDSAPRPIVQVVFHDTCGPDCGPRRDVSDQVRGYPEMGLWVGAYNLQPPGQADWERTGQAQHGFWRWTRAVYEGRREIGYRHFTQLRIELQK